MVTVANHFGESVGYFNFPEAFVNVIAKRFFSPAQRIAPVRFGAARLRRGRINKGDSLRDEKCPRVTRSVCCFTIAVMP